MSKLFDYLEGRMESLRGEQLYGKIITNQDINKTDPKWNIKQKIDEEIDNLNISSEAVFRIYSEIAARIGLDNYDFKIAKDKIDEASALLDENKIWHSYWLDLDHATISIFDKKESSKGEQLIEKHFNMVID